MRIGVKLRLGERVIQLVKDYNRELFNGDLGVISAIDTEDQEVKVQFLGRDVTYDYAYLNDLALGIQLQFTKLKTPKLQ